MDLSEAKHLPVTDYAPAELDLPRRLLLKGAALIEERGHYKGGYSDGQRLCFRGAVNMACGTAANTGASASDDASLLLLRYLDARGTPARGGWLQWNDAPERTADEVVSAMRAAAFYSEITA